jgi:hypothetical protein
VRLTSRPALIAAISWLMQKIRMSLSWIVARPLTEGVTVTSCRCGCIRGCAGRAAWRARRPDAPSCPDRPWARARESRRKRTRPAAGGDPPPPPILLMPHALPARVFFVVSVTLTVSVHRLWVKRFRGKLRGIGVGERGIGVAPSWDRSHLNTEKRGSSFPIKGLAKRRKALTDSITENNLSFGSIRRRWDRRETAFIC